MLRRAGAVFQGEQCCANYGAREGDAWFEVRAVILPNGESVATVKG